MTKDGAVFQLADGTRVRLTFDDGRLNASAGCNIIGGTFSIDGDRLIFTGASMTEMGCAEPRMSQDQWLIDFLGSSPTFVLDGNDLTLTSGTTVVTLLDREVAEPDQPFVGTTWSLNTLIDGGTASSIPVGVDATITFSADGTFSMHDGCNSGGGKYTVDGDTITFSEVVMTKIACSGAASQVEQAVLAVIRTRPPVAFATDAGSLSFTSGAAGLQFSSTATQ